MPIPTATDQPGHSSQTTFYLEWLDFGANGKTPKWDVTAFPNYEDETTDRAYALKCYHNLAAQDPDRIRLVQSHESIQIIAAQGLDTVDRETLSPTVDSESVASMPVWLTDRQITLLNYLLCQQRHQLEADGDPEPLAKGIQSDGRPTAERAGFLMMQLLQLMAAVELTHYRLVFIANQATTPDQQQRLVNEWCQHLPTAVIYQTSLGGNGDCVVWHLYLPANQGKPTEDQLAKAITAAQVIANVDFDHQEPVYGSAYGEFMQQHPGTRVSPSTSPVAQP